MPTSTDRATPDGTRRPTAPPQNRPPRGDAGGQIRADAATDCHSAADTHIHAQATPRPTPTPAPTPSCKEVPNLVGSTVTAARAAWTAAGFTGALQQVRRPNLWYVKSQDPSAGACVAVSSSMSVTTAKTP